MRADGCLNVCGLPQGPGTARCFRVSWISMFLGGPGLARTAGSSLGPPIIASVQAWGSPRLRAHALGTGESRRGAGHRAQPTECYWWHRVAEKLLLREEGDLLCCSPLVRSALLQAPRSARPGTTPRLSLCPEFKPPRCPGGCCRRPYHRRRSCVPWGVGGAASCSMGPSPQGAGPHSPGPCPGLGAPPVGRGGGR